jgi:hypothetical protein
MPNKAERLARFCSHHWLRNDLRAYLAQRAAPDMNKLVALGVPESEALRICAESQNAAADGGPDVGI